MSAKCSCDDGRVWGIGCGDGGCALTALRCEQCEGTGTRVERPAAWAEQGALHQQVRFESPGGYESMAQAAGRYGVSVALISKAERGLAELPAPALDRLAQLSPEDVERMRQAAEDRKARRPFDAFVARVTA